MTRDIWLVRHASTSWTGTRWCGRSDPPLTPGGETEAAWLGRLLHAVVPGDVAMVSSPARRARSTARSIAAGLGSFGGPTVATDDDLQEVDFGLVDGLTFEDIEARWPKLAASLANGETSIDWPVGETADEVRERATRAWTRLAATTSLSTVLAVTHGGLIAVILRDVLGEPDPGSIHISPATAIRARRIDGFWIVDRALPAVARASEQPVRVMAPA